MPSWTRLPTGLAEEWHFTLLHATQLAKAGERKRDRGTLAESRKDFSFTGSRACVFWQTANKQGRGYIEGGREETEEKWVFFF
jgi:hypothetical protein